MIKNLNKNLLGAALLATVALSAAPASAAKPIGCGGDHMMKVNDWVSGLPDAEPNKWVAVKELALANTALSESKPGECAAHLNRAEHAGMAH
ncbi:hypothetical protein [Bradyrhizobium sp. 2TAF24]|uniref:hypothetical protein n=1 Tax=Bradyrhizobium sp. 2TAF24 TaxID=3233011 RepID=UPI003F929ED0